MAKSTAPRDFGFGPDEELLRDLARKHLDEQMPVEKHRKLVATDFEAAYERGERPDWDRELWSQIVELGWTGLAVPEEAGGSGFRTVGVAALVEEVGRHALPSPLVATLGATWALRCGDEDVAKPWLGRIADGATGSLAITDREGTWEPTATGLTAEADGAGVTLSGEAHFVQDAFKADLLVASARLGDATDPLVLCVVPADAAGVTLEQNHIHDLTRDQATVRFERVRVGPDAVVSRDAAGALERAWPALLVLAAADLCGCAEWQLQATAEYARTRTQFDRPIGFFQAVKHPIVDAMIAIDRARSLLYSAACCIDFEPERALVAARMAKSAASDAGAFVSDRSVQLHGGIGFTWESDVHLFFKRSMHGQALFGDGAHQRSRLADVLIGPVGASADATAGAD
jgi:alkylation response protein AidB-like acyl-CoA dehydrogenase